MMRWKNSMRSAWLAILGAWLSGLASIGLTWFQSRWHVFHPHYLPLFILYIALALSTFVALVCCLWRSVRGPNRIHAILLAIVAMLPAGVWVFIGLTAKVDFEHRRVPNTPKMRLAKAMGTAFIRAEADLRYRNRLQTERLVMYYDHLNHPERDLAEMDRHLARLEDLLGGTIHARVFWIRGPLPAIGQGWLSVHGLSLGSDSSPEILDFDSNANLTREYRGDRHELAHAALDWFRTPDSDPPCVLHEGWAMAQCGDASAELAQAAANARLENPSLGVREMLGPDWYYRDSGPVYPIGGAFVDFLIRTRGVEIFRRFALECRQDTVEAKCREIMGTDLIDLEAEFWKDVESTLSESGHGPMTDDETDSSRNQPESSGIKPKSE